MKRNGADEISDIEGKVTRVGASERAAANEFQLKAKRSSACDCTGSGMVNERRSPKTVEASSKLMPCLSKFDSALFASLGVSTPINHIKVVS
jgi:hypothetical protein